MIRKGYLEDVRLMDDCFGSLTDLLVKLTINLLTKSSYGHEVVVPLEHFVMFCYKLEIQSSAKGDI